MARYLRLAPFVVPFTTAQHVAVLDVKLLVMSGCAQHAGSNPMPGGGHRRLSAAALGGEDVATQETRHVKILADGVAFSQDSVQLLENRQVEKF